MNLQLRRSLGSFLAVLLIAGLLPASVLAAAPAALPDAATVGVGSSATSIDVLANDSGEAITLTGVTVPAHGTATIDGDMIHYTPSVGYRGTDAFTYTIEDAAGATATATVSVIVNDPPVALDDPGIPCGNLTNFGGAWPIPEDYRGDLANYGWFGGQVEWFILFGSCGLLANDTDPNGDPLTYEIYTQPAHGAAMKVDESFFAYKPDPNWGTLAGDLPGGSWVSDSFTYRAFDGLSWSEPATMRYWVAQINDVPTFTPGPAMVIVQEGVGAYSGQWATEVDPGPYESNQTVHFELDGPAQLQEYGNDGRFLPGGGLFTVDPAIDRDGVLTFTVSPGMSGWARVRMVAKDDGGMVSWGSIGQTPGPDDTSDQFTFDITVVSDGMTLIDDHALLPEDPDPGPWLVNVLGNDDVLAGSTISAVSQGTRGTTTITPAGDAVLYAPDPDANGVDTFTYTVDDHDGVTDTATVHVTIDPVPDAPDAIDDAATVPRNAPATAIDVVGNDVDVDGDPLTIQSASNGTHGTVSVTGGGSGLTYDPATGYDGPDVFTYVVHDGTGRTDTASVHVTVSADTTAPIVVPPAQRFLIQTVGTSTMTTRITWSATDPGSGIRSYQVQGSVNGGAYATIALVSPTRTFIDRVITNGVSYRYRVRATDVAGNLSGWVYSPTFKPLVFQESSALATYTGAWSTAKSSVALGGAVRYTGTLGKSVQFANTAYDIALVMTKTASSGSADIYIDGVLSTRINLKASKTTYRQLVYTKHFATLGAHTIGIRPIGTGRVDIDGFAVLR